MANWRILTVIYIAIIADSVASNIMTPFAPDWVEHGLGLGRSWKGMYAGLLIGLFPVAVAISSPILGYFSDTYGRKPLLLFGLVTSAFFTSLLFATNIFWVAVVARTAAGLTDSSQSVAYAAIGDCSKGADRTMAFAYASAAFQIARMLSSVIGGFTVGYNFSIVPGQSNGYLLPAFIGSVACVVSAVLTFFFMEETIPKLVRRSSSQHTITAPLLSETQRADTNSVDHSSSSQEPVATARTDLSEPTGREWQETELLNHTDESDHRSDTYQPPSVTGSSDSADDQSRAALESPTSATIVLTVATSPTAALVTEHAFPHEPTTHSHNAAPNSSSAPEKTPAAKRTGLVAGMQLVWRDALMMRVILCYSGINFFNGAVLVLIPLLCNLEAYRHGFGMSSMDTGILLTVFAVWATIFQFTMFKPLIARSNLVHANALGCILMAVACLALPMAGYAVDVDPDTHSVNSRAAMWSVAVTAMIIMGSGFMLCASLLNTMISNLTKPGQQGLVQGVSRFWASMLRGFGPFICGFAFSWSVDYSHLPLASFALIAAGYLTVFICMLPVVPASVEKSKE